MPMLDQYARDQIRNDLDCNMVVEAAAGTGKTRNSCNASLPCWLRAELLLIRSLL